MIYTVNIAFIYAAVACSSFLVLLDQHPITPGDLIASLATAIFWPILIVVFFALLTYWWVTSKIELHEEPKPPTNLKGTP